MNCGICGAILTATAVTSPVFLHHHDCPEHPRQKRERLKLVAMMAATMERNSVCQIQPFQLAHRAEVLLAAVETGAEARWPVVDTPGLRNIAQIIAGSLELLPQSERRDTALRATYDRLIPFIENLEIEAASEVQR
jgi:hypothetical protein